ncbi:MAG TPA: hypothetical protein VHZ32_05965 [Rhizomicrobium sp.]|nr:hypothetical protein [Rhizomicrobium sp.]
MNQQIFSDGIGSIAIIGGVVRIDLIVYSPTEKDAAGQPKPVFQQQVVMSAEAFLRSTEKMQSAAQSFAKLATQPRPIDTRPVPLAPAAAEPVPAAAVLQPVERPFP